MNRERVLLLGGGGAIGSFVAPELLKLGFRTDVVCLEDKASNNPDLRYIKADIDDAFLSDLLPREKYDAIVDFLHYSDPADYETRHRLLLENTKHLIFLSSYRVYADEQHPITEDAPQLLDVSRDEIMLREETYGISKSRNERILRASPYRHWTIVRPVISFSHVRFSLVTQQSGTLLTRTRMHRKILLPEAARSVVAGLDWAGNVGKLLAHLVRNEKAYGEAFTLSSGQVCTWGEIAEYFTELMGSQFVWTDTKTYLENATPNEIGDGWGLYTDRLCDRTIDNRKVLEATGLTHGDFLSIRDALAREIALIPENPVINERLGAEANRKTNEKIDAYLKAHHLD